jgi:MerR family transcriptional regulator, light-induced transcriptional regulator
MHKSPETEAFSQSLAEPSRRAILEALRTGQKSVNELVEITGRKQPNVSNHLSKMREQGIVRAERYGRQVYYTLDTPYADLLVRLHEATAEPAPFPTGAETPVVPLRRQGRPNLNAYSQAYVEAALAGQEERVTALVNSLLSEHVPLETIYMTVFQKAMQIVGEWYVDGKANEAHEHLATALTERMMARVTQFYAPVTRMPYHALLGCVEGNWHALGLRMLADGLRMAGWETRFMGASVPNSSFLSLVRQTAPHLVVISCMMESQLLAAVSLVSDLKTLRSDLDLNFQIAVGGHFLHQHPEALRMIAPDFSANDLSDFLKTVRKRFAPPAL